MCNPGLIYQQHPCVVDIALSVTIGLSQRKISLKREERRLFSVLTAHLPLLVYWDIYSTFLIRQICVCLWEEV